MAAAAALPSQGLLNPARAAPVPACRAPASQRRRKQFSLLLYVIEELQRTAEGTGEELADPSLGDWSPGNAGRGAGASVAMDVDG
jgi:hypothetical protein